MNKYLVIYYAPAEAMATMATAIPEEKEAGMGAWMAWKEKAGDAVVNFGAPLMPGQNSTNGNDWTASNNEVSGYSVLQAESMEALQALCVDHPHLQSPGATLGLHEVMPM